MIWALLAILGVPIWLIVGFLAAIVLSRRAFHRQPGVFDVAVRDDDTSKWPRRPAYGRIVGNVLVLNRGAALLRTEIRAVTTVAELEIGEGPKKPTDAVGRTVTFDDGSGFELALAPDAAARLDSLA